MKTLKNLKVGCVLVFSSVVDQIGKFWVVTKPTNVSVLQDILFEADISYMMNQALGGLKTHDIAGIFKSEQQAKQQAEKLLGK